MAEALKGIADRLGIGLVFKASYDKANRTSLSGARGIGMAGAMAVFAEIKQRFGLPVLTDVHEPGHCAPAAEVVDILQIPAFLCRQTDLLVAAAETGRVVNIKKGQFLAPWDMKNVIAKVTGSGNPNVLVTERGTSFGYNTLVTDMRGLPRWRRWVRRWCSMRPIRCSSRAGWAGPPAGSGNSSPSWPAPRSRSAWPGVFIETHEAPERAPSDGPNMIALRDFPALIEDLMAFDVVAKARRIVLPA